MNHRIKGRVYIPLYILLVMLISFSCSTPDSPVIPAITDNASESTVDSSSVDKSSDVPDEKNSSVLQLKPPDLVEIIYFYAPQRCPNCIFIEKRVTFVVENYFQDEVDRGMLIFKTLNLGDKENAGIADKYKAISSQLFINSVVDEVDHIKTIKEVWFKEYLKDEKAFEEVIKSYIERSLNGEPL